MNIPILSCLMKFKKEICYVNVFENFKILLYENNIKIDFDKIKIMTDFEISLRKAVRYSFPNSPLIGCYFHYLKSIIKKIKELGLFKKKQFPSIYNIIFIFKLFPFINEIDKKDIILYIIKNYIKKNDNDSSIKIYRLISFFIKNWFGNEFLDFRSIADNTLQFRTNNTVERFNFILNNTIKHFKPKISFFLEKYKLLIKSYYNKYIKFLY